MTILRLQTILWAMFIGKFLDCIIEDSRSSALVHWYIHFQVHLRELREYANASSGRASLLLGRETTCDKGAEGLYYGKPVFRNIMPRYRGP